MIGDTCPLCSSKNTNQLDILFKNRSYCKCDDCFLIFSDRDSLPSLNVELERYKLHENNILNKGYRNFLDTVLQPLLLYINKTMTGLDYGCGPNPVLSLMLHENGFSCDNYDPLFFNNIIKSNYDYVISTESFEHFHFPIVDIPKIIALIRPGGYLAIMTETWKSPDQLQSWYYLRDITHVSFYHVRTMNFIASSYSLKLLYTDNDRVYIFRKINNGRITLL